MPLNSNEVYGAKSPRRKRMALYALPLLVIAGLLVIYAVSPSFYLRVVLQEQRREMQAVEIVTFICAFAGAILTLRTAWRRFRPSHTTWSVWGEMGAVAIMAAIGLAALFFAGEEINYGQTWFGSDVEGDMQGVVNDFNVHNHFELFSIQGLGSLFLIVTFLLLPLAWRKRDRFGLPAGWSPAIAEGPVVLTIFIAFLWKEVKNIYRAMVDVGDPPDPRFYWEFLEQANEQKEMLVAIGILMYGIYRARDVHGTGASWDQTTSRRGSPADARR